MIDYLYSDQTHYDAVKLIICCADGTPYQDFIHQMVEVEVDATFQFLKTLHRLGKQPADKAMAILQYTPKAACEPVMKVLKSAMANAENNHNMDVSRLYVSDCNVGAGPTLKRIQARAQGRAYRINKRTSHITITVKEMED